MQARMVEDTGSLFGRIRKAIFHGTLIPKGHGRLIDADALDLDKIRAEIEQVIREETMVDCSGGEYERIVSTLDPDDVFEIIDKYRTESEETDADSN